MKIYSTKYKNLQGIQVETERYTAVFIPSEGGKMVSFKDKSNGKEYLLQNPSKEFLTLGEFGDYVKSECSGFDDMFPTIDEVEVVKNGVKVVYPDHGEVCRLSFNYKIKDGELLMFTESSKLEYFYQKSVYESKNGHLCIKYEIENLASSPFEILWAAHCLINAENGGKIVAPFLEGELFDLIFDTNGRFGKGGERLNLADKHLSHRFKKSKGECRKYYFAEKCKNGFVAYQYPSGKRFVMNFDKEQLPFLGIWLNYGHLNGAYCVGLEPCMVGYDSVENAKKYGQRKVLEPNEITAFTISLGIE